MCSVNSTDEPIACSSFGDFPTPTCCYASNITNPVCQDILNQNVDALGAACPRGPNHNCFIDCGDPQSLYFSDLQENYTGNGALPIIRYETCANIPSIAKGADHGLLPQNVTNAIRPFIPANASHGDLMGVTAALTECLSAVCSNSRSPDTCYYDHCSPFKLLTNNTTPNLYAINDCLHTLCSTNNSAYLPFADPDVTGIGVWSSYVIQCILILILWLGCAGYAFRQHKTHKADEPWVVGQHHLAWLDLLVSFHTTQCYFGTTLMIASFVYGLYQFDMLITFLLIPLATNSILPVVFAYFLITYHRKSSIGCMLLTGLTYLLGTIVYWSLYRHLYPLTGNLSTDPFIYRQFMFKLSSLPQCGGYSGLAVCPRSDWVVSEEMATARWILLYLTPIIWTISTIVLLALFVQQISHHICAKRGMRVPWLDADSRFCRVAFWSMTILLAVAVGLQISVLGVSYILNMMNKGDWGFGQIVAVTIWIPPMLEYTYGRASKVTRNHGDWWRSKSDANRASEKKNSLQVEREQNGANNNIHTA